MAILVTQGQVATSDPNPGGPSPISGVKNVFCKVAKLTSANFSTTNVDTLVIELPADATILSFRLWVRTQLAGGSVSAATVAIGSASGGAQFHAASALAFGTAGTYTVLPTPLAIMQNYNVPLGADIQIWARGTATTGNPTSGELYLMVEYTR
jgi:hypothetical protein